MAGVDGQRAKLETATCVALNPQWQHPIGLSGENLPRDLRITSCLP
jgi:hypothetical protein